LGSGDRYFFTAETDERAAKWRKRGRFLLNTEMAHGDRTGWLGREDSNLRMAESKSADSARKINDRSE